MKRITKKLITSLLTAAVTVGILAGCGSGGTGESSTGGGNRESSSAEEGNGNNTAAGEVETVTVYQLAFGDFNQEAVEQVEASVNPLLEERYGINLDLVYLSMGDFSTQTNLALTSDEVDVIAMYQSISPITNLVDNGQIIALDEYWANASDDLKACLNEDEIKGMTFQGNLYALNRKYLVGGELRLIMDENIINELGVDISEIYTWESIDELFEKVHEAYPDIYVLVPASNDRMCEANWYLGDDLSMGNYIVSLPENGAELGYLYENPKFVEWCDWMHKWYEEGMILPDVLSNTTNGEDYVKAGRAFAYFQNGDIYNNLDEGLCYRRVLGEPRILAAGYTNVGYGISTNSTHKDAAWKLLEAMYTDSEIANMITYGIEGTDYIVQEDGTVAYPEGVDGTTALYPGVSFPFVWPNYQILYPTYIQGADYIANVDTYNNAANPSEATGFVWDSSEHTDELTACAQIYNQYYCALLAGMVDPDEILPRAIEELNAAGGDKVLESVKEQYSEFQGQ